jgi:uncharacterized protein YPO0396
VEQVRDEETGKAIEQIEGLINRDGDAKLLADYRNYYQFDIDLYSVNAPPGTPPQSYGKIAGTLSGGQRQAPFYLSIGASMMSVFFPNARERGTDGASFFALDEAFNKLDQPTTRKLVDLYKDLSLQPMIAAPDILRSTFLAVFDCIISVSRIEGTDKVILDIKFPGERAREEMRVANPENLGVEAFRPRVAANKADAA